VCIVPRVFVVIVCENSRLRSLDSLKYVGNNEVGSKDEGASQQEPGPIPWRSRFGLYEMGFVQISRG
jgi:hypothetical protein